MDHLYKLVHDIVFRDFDNTLRFHILQLVNYVTLLKIKVLYSFHEDPLTSMDTFHCTKGSLKWKSVSIDY